MAFQFSLQKILNLRGKDVEECQKNMQLTKLSLDKLKLFLENQKNNYFQQRDELNQFITKNDLSQVKIYEVSLAQIQNRMMEILKSIRDVQLQLKTQEHELTQAKLKQKTLEKLYEKKYKEFQDKESQIEQRRLDEMANLAYIKSQWDGDNEN